LLVHSFAIILALSAVHLNCTLVLEKIFFGEDTWVERRQYAIGLIEPKEVLSLHKPVLNRNIII